MIVIILIFVFFFLSKISLWRIYCFSLVLPTSFSPFFFAYTIVIELFLYILNHESTCEFGVKQLNIIPSSCILKKCLMYYCPALSSNKFSINYCKNYHSQPAEAALIVSSIVTITYFALTEFAGSNITQYVNVFSLSIFQTQNLFLTQWPLLDHIFPLCCLITSSCSAFSYDNLSNVADKCCLWISFFFVASERKLPASKIK